jgi:hypothetical protein
MASVASPPFFLWGTEPTDQRGMPRPDKPEDKVGCEMGAFEKQSDWLRHNGSVGVRGTQLNCELFSVRLKFQF